MNTLAPIALFCFNRPNQLQRTVEALSKNTLATTSHITFFCDGPRSDQEKHLTDAVREIARSTTGFASVTMIEREKNMGCARSVRDGLQQMFAEHENLIVMEDDILCSTHTLEFLNKGLDLYKDNPKVFSISAWSVPPKLFELPANYPHDVYAIPLFGCWGWASWRDRFKKIDWEVSDYETFKNSPEQRKAYRDILKSESIYILDAQMSGKMDTWAIIMDYDAFKRELVTIYPMLSYTTNIGMGCGTHTNEKANKYDNDITKSLPVDDVRFVKDANLVPEILQRYRSVGKDFFYYLKRFKLYVWNALVATKRLLTLR